MRWAYQFGVISKVDRAVTIRSKDTLDRGKCARNSIMAVKYAANIALSRQVCPCPYKFVKILIINDLSSVAVYISGILASISSACLGLFCVLSIIQIAMISSRDKVVMKYKPLVIIKLMLAIAAGKLFKFSHQ